MTNVEVFAVGGIASGRAAPAGELHDSLESEAPLDLDGVTWYPLAGGAAEPRPAMHLDSDEVLVIAVDDQDLPIHATWHAVELDLGPYRVTGELPTQPGFDPGRALVRPGGPFVLLRDVRVEIAGRPEGGRVDRPHASVNRYAVERVAADIDLGFFFPGARFLTAAGVPLG
ncbi:MAG: hypothetical protein ABIV26_06810 [Candidatus Limnocylindrales bacterium]